MTVYDLLYSGLRIAGVLRGAQRVPGPSDLQDGLLVLNSMIDAWKAQRLMVYAILRSVFTINAGQAIYTIGTSGSPDFFVERPRQIHQAGFIFTNTDPNIETPLRILTTQEWASLSPKQLTGPIPSMLYYEPFLPNGNINLWPIPLNTWQLALYLWQTVNQFVAPTDPVVIAPAYQEAIEYNLAIRLAVRFPERALIQPDAKQIAREALARVKAINEPALLMQTEAIARGTDQRQGHYNILSNRYTG